MSQSEIESISALVNGEDRTIAKRDARLLTQFTWWHNDLASKMVNNEFPDHEWFHKTREEFLEFRRRRVPLMTKGGGTKTSTTASQSIGEVDGSVVQQFQKSIKMDVSDYPYFGGALDAWLPFKRKLKAITATHGIERVIAVEDPVLAEGSQDARLYQMQKQFLYSVFTQKLTGGLATLALRRFEEAKDARSVYT